MQSEIGSCVIFLSFVVWQRAWKIMRLQSLHENHMKSAYTTAYAFALMAIALLPASAFFSMSAS